MAVRKELRLATIRATECKRSYDPLLCLEANSCAPG
jgi:hypothetical protein